MTKTKIHKGPAALDLLDADVESAAVQTLAEARNNPPEPLRTAPAGEFPVEALGPILGPAAADIARIEGLPVATAAFTVINAVDYLTQSRIDAYHPGTGQKNPSGLYTLILADSGDRKSTAFKAAFKVIHEARQQQHEQFERDLAEWTARRKQCNGKRALDEFDAQNPAPVSQDDVLESDASYSRIASDFIGGIDRPGAPALYWEADEGALMLTGHSMSDDSLRVTAAGLCKLYDSGKVQRVRSRANADGGGTAYERRMALGLSAQEVTVRKALGNEVLQGGGLLPRFLLTAPKSLAGTRTKNRIIDPEKARRTAAGLQTYYNQCRAIMRIPPALKEGNPTQIDAPFLSWDDAAVDRWYDFYNATEKAQGPGGQYALMKPWASRAGEQMARLATKLAYFHGHATVTDSDATGAMLIVEHSLTEWARYLEAESPSGAIRDAIALENWLLTKATGKQATVNWQQFTMRELAKDGPNFLRRNKARRDTALAILVSRNRIIQGGGRYALHPDIIEAFLRGDPIQ